MTALPVSIGKVAARSLSEHDISSLELVAKHSEKKLLSIHGVGPKAIRLLKIELEKANLSLQET